MALIGIAALSIGTLLLLTQAEEPKQDRKVIHLTEVTCRTFTELTQQEQGIRQMTEGLHRRIRRLCHQAASASAGGRHGAYPHGAYPQGVGAIYDLREFAAAGGLMSYGSSLTDAYQ
jgi:hypothetical protein